MKCDLTKKAQICVNNIYIYTGSTMFPLKKEAGFGMASQWVGDSAVLQRSGKKQWEKIRLYKFFFFGEFSRIYKIGAFRSIGGVCIEKKKRAVEIPV